MNLKELLLKKFKNEKQDIKQLSKKELEELINKEVEKRIIAEIEKIDKDFIKSLSEDLPSLNEEDKNNNIQNIIDEIEKGN